MFHNVVSGTVQKGIKSVACEGTSYAYQKADKPMHAVSSTEKK